MPTLNKPGARIAAAGAAAAALTLAAGAPAFAQEADYSGVTGSFALIPVDGYDYGDLDPTQTVVQQYQGATLTVDITDEQLQQADVLEVYFIPQDDLITAFPDIDSGSFCQADGDSVVCTLQVVEDTVVADEMPFEFNFQLNDPEAYGVGADYVVETHIDGELIDSHEGELDVRAGTPVGGGDDEEPVDPPVEEDPNEVEDGTEYEFALLNYILEGANPGETLTGFPQVRVNSAPAEDRAATVLWFEDSSDVDAWFENGEVVYTDAVEVIADYDNCKRADYTVYCVMTDFDPQVGSTYTASEDTPVLYEVLKAVTDADGAAYGAYDINQEGLDEALADGLDPESDNRLSLVETDMNIEDKYFSDVWGFVFFAGDDRGHGDVPPANDGGELPTTGSSSIVMISAAAAAIAAGAVVFFVMRRRRAAQNWE